MENRYNAEQRAIRAYRAAAKKATIASRKLGAAESEVWKLKQAAGDAVQLAKHLEAEMLVVLRGDVK